MAKIRLFAAAREAAARPADSIDAETLDELLVRACATYGERFTLVLYRSRVWVNGEEPHDGACTRLSPSDEVAVLPPVSGG